MIVTFNGGYFIYFHVHYAVMGNPLLPYSVWSGDGWTHLFTKGGSQTFLRCIPFFEDMSVFSRVFLSNIQKSSCSIAGSCFLPVFVVN